MKRFIITAAMLLSATLWWSSESPVLSNDDGWGQNPENPSSPQAISCGALVPTPYEAGKPVPFLGYENVAGEAYQTATWLGNLRYAPPTYMGTIAMYFYQGSPTSEACRGTDEGQFRHRLTRTIAVMETEVTRNAWANLKFLQPTLPADPTDTSHSSGMNDPVQNVTWQEAILFANLYSQWAGLTRCYYTNSSSPTPAAPSAAPRRQSRWVAAAACRSQASRAGRVSLEQEHRSGAADSPPTRPRTPYSSDDTRRP